MYGAVKSEIGEIIKYICKLEGVELIKGAVCIDHVHMYIYPTQEKRSIDYVAYQREKCTDVVRQTP